MEEEQAKTTQEIADMQAAMEQPGIETAERQQVPEQTALVEAQAEAVDDTEVPQ